MDRASLQHEGENTLALTRALTAADLATLSVPASGDASYFPPLGVLVRYPGRLVWPLAILALAAVVAAGWWLVRRREAGWLRLLGGFGLAVVPLVLAPVVAQGFWALLVLLRPGYANMFDPWWPGWFRAAVVALVALTVLLWFGLLRRRVGSWPLVIGALGLLAVLGVVMAAILPGGSYLAALPALVGGLRVLATHAERAVDRGHSSGRRGRRAAVHRDRAAGGPFRRDHPAPAELAYILDIDTGQAKWISSDARPGQWVSQYVTEPGTTADTFGLVHGPVTVGPAQAAALPAPQVGVVDDTITGDRRTLTLRVTPQRPPERPARLIYLTLSDAPVLGATLQGREVPPDELTDGLSVVFHAPPAEGIDVTLELGTTGPVTLRALDGSDGLEGLSGFTPRPPGVGIAGSHTSEMAVVAKTYTF